MALRCVLEKVGRLGYKNHLNLTKRCFLNGISIKNHHQNLIRSFCRYSSSSSSTRLTEIIDYVRKELKDLIHLENPVAREAFESGCAGGTRPFFGNMDDDIKAARAAVEQHNKQQNSNLEFVRVLWARRSIVAGLSWKITFEASDAGMTNTYQARVWQTISDGWKLRWFKLIRAAQRPSNHPAVMPGCTGGTLPFFGNMDDDLLKAARAAVEQHNKQQNSNLEFVRVLWARTRFVAGLIWNITFEASDAGMKNTYQAEVWQTISDGCKLRWFKLIRASQRPSNHPAVMPGFSYFCTTCRKNNDIINNSTLVTHHRCLFTLSLPTTSITNTYHHQQAQQRSQKLT